MKVSTNVFPVVFLKDGILTVLKTGDNILKKIRCGVQVKIVRRIGIGTHVNTCRVNV